MRRLRTLSEAECYCRCYGGMDESVKVFRVERPEREEIGLGLTNAALRTTSGSGDLRRRDFAGSAERLSALADELRPRWLAFVGKEAYRGAFNERPDLGEQQRRLGETRIFVLPSTSPAN